MLRETWCINVEYMDGWISVVGREWKCTRVQEQAHCILGFYLQIFISKNQNKSTCVWSPTHNFPLPDRIAICTEFVRQVVFCCCLPHLPRSVVLKCTQCCLYLHWNSICFRPFFGIFHCVPVSRSCWCDLQIGKLWDYHARSCYKLAQIHWRSFYLSLQNENSRQEDGDKDPGSRNRCDKYSNADRHQDRAAERRGEGETSRRWRDEKIKQIPTMPAASGAALSRHIRNGSEPSHRLHEPIEWVEFPNNFSRLGAAHHRRWLRSIKVTSREAIWHHMALGCFVNEWFINVGRFFPLIVGPGCVMMRNDWASWDVEEALDVQHPRSKFEHETPTPNARPSIRACLHVDDTFREPL